MARRARLGTAIAATTTTTTTPTTTTTTMDSVIPVPAVGALGSPLPSLTSIAIVVHRTPPIATAHIALPPPPIEIVLVAIATTSATTMTVAMAMPASTSPLAQMTDDDIARHVHDAMEYGVRPPAYAATPTVSLRHIPPPAVATVVVIEAIVSRRRRRGRGRRQL